MNVTFPQDFWWGAATSGPQSEGRFNKANANVFDYWYEIEPEVFYDQVGPDTASNFYHSFREDIQLMKDIGLNSVRTSIQWTRLIKNLETGEVDEDGVRFYHDVIDAFLAADIRPVIALHHFDLPVDLYHKYGGWTSKKVVKLFADFAETCFNLYSEKVTDWFTFNEPMVIVDGQYLHQIHYPNLVDGKKAVQTAYHLQLASAMAIERFRKSSKNEDGKIGIILNLTPSYPASDKVEDLQAATHANLWKNKLFLDASVKGVFPSELVDLLKADNVFWQGTSEEEAIIRENTIDYLGINYYHPSRVKAPDVSANSLAVDWVPSRYFDKYAMPGRRMNVDKGWEIFPKAIYDIAIDIRDNYDNIDWFVSENGMGVSREERFLQADGSIADDYRIQFMKEHLSYLHQAISEGSHCFGYHSWTPIDCWSWMNAYRNRYGFISNNIHTQIKTIKKSGYWFKSVVDNNGLSVDQ
ncbi:hypothetical protein A5886_001016 [Enterococcus sp. 8G7_MSG3316]|uniref:Beta-glucosidase n=1 Tax=Candidatus Enterococcus testudinis TaxID=1834191 RepID=A0A242A4W7_9ENTE|nr:glycoside hydrolase family 1 protein [Enterococcus sp. 8G7_MSG3316]OTN75940.1 hypothetical protein A5886_001016 [Enterococcus sp. 8G7_MSG3316]